MAPAITAPITARIRPGHPSRTSQANQRLAAPCSTSPATGDWGEGSVAIYFFAELSAAIGIAGIGMSLFHMSFTIFQSFPILCKWTRYLPVSFICPALML